MNKDCIIVTGASRGIGAAIALALSGQGQVVACMSRSGAFPEVGNVPEDVKSRLLRVRADVTDPQAVQEAMRQLQEDGWRITGLVNNAGVHTDAASADLTLEDWHHVMNANATSVMTTCQAAYPYLVASGGGVIVNIGSFFDKLGVKRNVAYCASKAAVGAITRCLAVEWASKGIRVVDVAPGYIVTDLNADAMAPGGPLRSYLEKRIPGREPGTAADIGAVVAFLLSPVSRFLSGETLYVDGAQGIAH